jgi:hypothetical protein
LYCPSSTAADGAHRLSAPTPPTSAGAIPRLQPNVPKLCPSPCPNTRAAAASAPNGAAYSSTRSLPVSATYKSFDASTPALDGLHSAAASTAIPRLHADAVKSPPCPNTRAAEFPLATGATNSSTRLLLASATNTSPASSAAAPAGLHNVAAPAPPPPLHNVPAKSLCPTTTPATASLASAGFCGAGYSSTRLLPVSAT